ncbi:MAG TPA: hypothetical protein VJK30_03370 [Coxiellaceae bacterium]|nr:hypothetical protein [Coxiellaceae bacterium]
MIKKQAHALFYKAGFIFRIKTEDDYENALALMEELIEEYDEYRPLIDMLSHSIEIWEEKSKSFFEFNKCIYNKDVGVAVLKTLMDQYQLGVADFPEIGSKSLVSKILNRQRRFTIDHLRALCKRFNLNPTIFF